MTNHQVSSLKRKGTRLLVFCMFIMLAFIGSATSTSKDDWGCGYSLDGIDDYASFSMGSRVTDIMHDQGFTMMFWHRNKRKDKDGHFEQCLMSHSNDDHAR